jgi:hypothetical protein
VRVLTAGYLSLRSRLVAWAALARALMTEQIPEQRERHDQHHGRDRAAADAEKPLIPHTKVPEKLANCRAATRNNYTNLICGF